MCLFIAFVSHTEYTVHLLYRFSLIQSGFDLKQKSFLLFEHVFNVTCFCQVSSPHLVEHETYVFSRA